ncbi:4-aminobutyrate aminotransferase [Providencia alcalifaciens]|uniref:4-aminobutyrate aminotransferase n=1 Tax=Providencia alcalifaciens TaxID=126385 RepID=A0AAW9V5Z7_9GAMM|nr:4-aminobutyrate aminotransferase [Providencia alcalifaciens]
MSLSNITLPERLQHAFDQWEMLEEQHLYFAPIRHHSPACAYSVLALIEQVKPDYVLIEGPDSFNPLIAGLLDGDTRPPVAIMGQTAVKGAPEQCDESDAVTKSAYFPFCEYSPEWQALRIGQQHQAQLRFIDLPWTAQVECDHESENPHHSLQRERYLAHSLFIAQLAKKCGCRDHDELWEHLFELRPLASVANWSGFFRDSFVWCALARLDYEPEVLVSEGSTQREAHMQAHIQTIKAAEPNAKIVVVTGGFHTLALIEGLGKTADQQFELSTEQQKQFTAQQKLAERDSAWLIRYSFDRLDALNGYASGMPSPAFYQKVWEGLLTERADQSEQKIAATAAYRNQLGIQFLAYVAEVLREKQFDAAPGFLSVKLAAEQSLRLAAFRGHTGAGRYDLLDGLQSAFIKGSLDESQDELWQQIKTCFSGFTLGQIPKGTLSPPLVSETYSLAKAFRFKLDDTLAKTSRLDVYRNKQHRLRSRFLHLLTFLEIHFAKPISGPNFLSGNQMDLLFEEWQYAWTPNVEGELIALSEKGTQLKSIALNKILAMEKQLEEQGVSRSSQSAVTLLMQAALIGLQQRIPTLFMLLDSYIQQDNKFESLVACGHKLVHLWRGRGFFDLAEDSGIKERINRVVQQIFFCLDQVSQGDEQQQEHYFDALLSCRELITFIPEISPETNYSAEFYAQLNRLDGRLNHTPLIKGAVDAIRYLGGKIDESVLINEIQRTFSLGSDPELAIGYFIGIMRTAPELVVRLPLLIEQLNELLNGWDDARFIQVLPDLRFAFSQLTPKQNAQMARVVAQKLSLETQDLTLHQTQFNQQELLQAMELEQKIQHQLIQQGVIGWFDESTEGQSHG